MKNKKSLLLICLIVSFVLIVSAVIVSLTAGMKLGTNVAGGYQIEVEVGTAKDLDKKVEQVRKVLNKNKVSVETIFVEDKDTQTLVVVRTADIDFNKETLRSDIATALKVDKSKVSELYRISGMVTKKAILWTGVAVVCFLLAIFVAGWLRYKLMGGLTLVFVTLHALLVNIAILVLTRLSINMVTMITVLITMILVLFAFVLLLEKIRENQNQKHNSDLSTEEIVALSEKNIAVPLIFVGALSVVISLVLLFVPVAYVRYVACALLVGIVVAVYTYCLVGVDIHKRLLEVKAVSDKAKLSKNVSVTPSKVKKKDAKK